MYDKRCFYLENRAEIIYNKSVCVPGCGIRIKVTCAKIGRTARCVFGSCFWKRLRIVLQGWDNKEEWAWLQQL
ncbi:MAG: hypothetical protein NC293_09930 [Roseburia sp.]|nr:hypothetical protein [Roseburia sp.]